MANPWLFATLRPAFVGEDYYAQLTLTNTNGSIQGWTLEATLTQPNGVAIPGAAVATIQDDTQGIILVSIVGQNFTTTQDLTLTVYRTDTGARSLQVWGTIEVVDPLQQLGWAQGMM